MTKEPTCAAKKKSTRKHNGEVSGKRNPENHESTRDREKKEVVPLIEMKNGPVHNIIIIYRYNNIA